MYDRVLNYPRLLKTSIVAFQIAFLWLSYRVFSGQIDNYVAGTALLVSGFWLALTSVRLNGLLRTYFDKLSQLQVMVPTICGVMLAGIALVCAKQIAFTLISALELLAWLAVYLAYRRNRANYITEGRGPVPKDTWVDPDAEALMPGDLILTSGRMAARLHTSVGHAELVIPGESGRLHTVTSYMENGTIINRLDALIKRLRADKIHYIALRLRTPFNKEQLSCAPELARQALEANGAWRKQSNEKREACINRLPLPKSWKSCLIKKTHATGYDWVGLFIGTRAKNRWTCIALCVEILKKLDVKINDYGTGLLGLGTGLLDPIQPVRLLGDKAYRLIDIHDRARFEASKLANKMA